MSRCGRRPAWVRLCSIAFVVLIVLPAVAPFPAVGDDGFAGPVRPTLTGGTRVMRVAMARDYQHAVPSARSAHARTRVRLRSGTGESRASIARGVGLPNTAWRPTPGRHGFLEQHLIVLRI